jgi:glucose-6-phosphate isomerase
MLNPDIRMLFDMKDVVYDHEWLSNANNVELYYMYRGISCNKDDKVKINEHRLRYDITIIPPYMLGCEFVKTAGHYHQIVPGTDITFPEMYEVLNGNACFLIQKPDHDGDSIKDIAIINAEEGNKVIVPPGYGHITVNISNNVLKIANWVVTDKESLYDPIKKKKGGAYFIE